MRVFVYLYVFTSAFVYICMFMRMYVCVCVCMCQCLCIYIRIDPSGDNVEIVKGMIKKLEIIASGNNVVPTKITTK